MKHAIILAAVLAATTAHAYEPDPHDRETLAYIAEGIAQESLEQERQQRPEFHRVPDTFDRQPRLNLTAPLIIQEGGRDVQGQKQ